MLGLALIFPVSVLAELHTFRLPDGRELQAEIVGFNPHKNLVELKKENGKTVRVKPDLFVTADRDYIEQWYMADVFMQNRTFVFKGEKRMIENWKENDYPEYFTYKEYGYECVIENKSPIDFEHLKLEYCIYWDQEKRVSKKCVNQNMSYAGVFDITTLKASSKNIINTESVVLHTMKLDSEWIYTDRGAKEFVSSMSGMWLRIILELDDGQKLVREFGKPDSLLHTVAWEGEEL
jgi:hypothetical protein